MGGDGSGRYPRSESRTTVDQCRILDIDSLNRDGLLALDTSRTTTWFNDGKPRASIGHHRTATSGGKALLRLSYAIPGRGDEKPRGRLLRSAHVHQVQLRQLPPVVRLSRIGVWRARRQALQTPARGSISLPALSRSGLRILPEVGHSLLRERHETTPGCECRPRRP